MVERKLKKMYIIIPLIVLVISIGAITFFTLYHRPKKIKMLDLNSYSIKEIEEYAQDNDLILDVEYLDNEDISKDKLISQSIETNTIINKGDHLKVVISKGPFDKSIYANMKVNELGRIPVMMYHGIQNVTKTNYPGGNIDKDGYQRTAAAFRQDLEFYYQNNYRMIRLDDYVQGIIDVPMGKSPLILTFDDGNANNIKVTGLTEAGDIIIDPNSAVGILEEYKHKYPDFQVTATFFVTNGLFSQPQYNDKILDWLVKNGYDIGNHTANHVTLGNVSQEEVTIQIGRVYNKLEGIIPNRYVHIISLPFGSPYNSDHKNFTNIMHGTYEDIEYTNIAALRVGWDADYSPFTKSFNSKYIKRIRAYDNEGKNFDIQMNFKLLESNRYISDGDKNKIVILNKDKDKLIETPLKVVTY